MALGRPKAAPFHPTHTFSAGDCLIEAGGAMVRKEVFERGFEALHGAPCLMVKRRLHYLGMLLLSIFRNGLNRIAKATTAQGKALSPGACESGSPRAMAASVCSSSIRGGGLFDWWITSLPIGPK